MCLAAWLSLRFGARERASERVFIIVAIDHAGKRVSSLHLRQPRTQARTCCIWHVLTMSASLFPVRCSADGNYEVRYKSNVLIYPTGQVMWIPPAIYQSSCTIDVTYFPFDQQKCVMKFGSWTFNGDQVVLKLYNDNDWVDLSDYWKSGTWDIVEVPAFLNVYNGTKNGKPTETDISFYITIRRKTLFYTVNLILPTLLISFLCILVFYLPAEAGECCRVVCHSRCAIAIIVIVCG